MITVNTEQQLSQADVEFIQLVDNRITAFGQIPYTIPQKLIIGVIKDSARYFHKHYHRATEKRYFRMLKDDILAASLVTGNNGNYLVTLPAYVAVLMEIYEADNGNGVPTSQELIENIQLLQRSAPYGQSILGINNSLYIIEAAARMIEEQAFSSIFKTSVPFNFNITTKSLNIRKTLQSNILLECLVNVDIQYLYNDDYFIRHVIGRCKQELKRIIAGHTIELPGGATLNADEICNNLEDVEKVEDIIKNSGGIGDLIFMR